MALVARHSGEVERFCNVKPENVPPPSARLLAPLNQPSHPVSDGLPEISYGRSTSETVIAATWTAWVAPVVWATRNTIASNARMPRC